jgi:hypothetical protein
MRQLSIQTASRCSLIYTDAQLSTYYNYRLTFFSRMMILTLPFFLTLTLPCFCFPPRLRQRQQQQQYLYSLPGLHSQRYLHQHSLSGVHSLSGLHFRFDFLLPPLESNPSLTAGYRLRSPDFLEYFLTIAKTPVRRRGRRWVLMIPRK